MKNQSHWPETEGTPMKSALFALNQTYVATKLYTLNQKTGFDISLWRELSQICI